MGVSLEYIRIRRNLPFIKRGMRIEVEGKMGTITSGNRSGNLNVRFDGDKHPQNCHPWWKTKYFDDQGNIIKQFD